MEARGFYRKLHAIHTPFPKLLGLYLLVLDNATMIGSFRSWTSTSVPLTLRDTDITGDVMSFAAAQTYGFLSMYNICHENKGTFK